MLRPFRSRKAAARRSARKPGVAGRSPAPAVLSLSFTCRWMVMSEELPALYVVPTPLGHLGDMTQRAIEVLRQVAWVAAEDTRHSGCYSDIMAALHALLAAHQHNEQSAAQQVIARLANGESVALVVDAGTPAVSDPGARLVARVRAAGYRVVPLPGPCAAIVALSAPLDLRTRISCSTVFCRTRRGSAPRPCAGCSTCPTRWFSTRRRTAFSTPCRAGGCLRAGADRGPGAGTDQVVRVHPRLSAC
jgi:hypothetical protein